MWISRNEYDELVNRVQVAETLAVKMRRDARKERDTLRAHPAVQSVIVRNKNEAAGEHEADASLLTHVLSALDDVPMERWLS